MSHQGAVRAWCSLERFHLSAGERNRHLFTHSVKERRLRNITGWKVRADHVQKGLLMPSPQGMKASLSDLSPSPPAHCTSHFLLGILAGFGVRHCLGSEF